MKLRSKNMSILYLINNQIIQPITEEKEIICQCSSGNEWIVGLFTIIGVFVGALINFIYRFTEKRKIIEAMTKSLFGEIASFRYLASKELPETKSVLNKFQKMYQSQNFNYSPAITYFGEPIKDYYDLHQSNIHLLEYDLRNDVVAFYGYMKSINDVAKKLDSMFKRFYKRDKTVGGQDVIKFLEKLIKQDEAIDLLGAEILAQLMVRYHTDEFKKTKGAGQKKRDIRNYLQNHFQIGEVINVKEVARITQSDLVLLNIVLLETGQFKKVKYGQYKKII